jgi:aldehyde:ferredoxin oxidoreductase
MHTNELIQAGERISNLLRVFYVREGVTRKSDTLPQRILQEPLPKGGIPPIEELLNQFLFMKMGFIKYQFIRLKKEKDLEI